MLLSFLVYFLYCLFWCIAEATFLILIKFKFFIWYLGQYCSISINTNVLIDSVLVNYNNLRILVFFNVSPSSSGHVSGVIITDCNSTERSSQIRPTHHTAGKRHPQTGSDFTAQTNAIGQWKGMYSWQELLSVQLDSTSSFFVYLYTSCWRSQLCLLVSSREGVYGRSFLGWWKLSMLRLWMRTSDSSDKWARWTRSSREQGSRWEQVYTGAYIYMASIACMQAFNDDDGVFYLFIFRSVSWRLWVWNRGHWWKVQIKKNQPWSVNWKLFIRSWYQHGTRLKIYIRIQTIHKLFVKP